MLFVISFDIVNAGSINALLSGTNSVNPFARSRNSMTVRFVVELLVVFATGTVVISPISWKLLKAVMFARVVERLAGIVRTASITLICTLL